LAIFQQERKIALDTSTPGPRQRAIAPEPLNIKQQVLSNTSASLFDPKRFDRPRSTTSKAPSTAMLGTPSQVATLNFPPEPELDQIDFFECPYCFILCPAREAQGKYWKSVILWVQTLIVLFRMFF
jgi:hypothetical protein